MGGLRFADGYPRNSKGSHSTHGAAEATQSCLEVKHNPATATMQGRSSARHEYFLQSSPSVRNVQKPMPNKAKRETLRYKVDFTLTKPRKSDPSFCYACGTTTSSEIQVRYSKPTKFLAGSSTMELCDHQVHIRIAIGMPETLPHDAHSQSSL